MDYTIQELFKEKMALAQDTVDIDIYNASHIKNLINITPEAEKEKVLSLLCENLCFSQMSYEDFYRIMSYCSVSEKLFLLSNLQKIEHVERVFNLNNTNEQYLGDLFSFDQTAFESLGLSNIQLLIRNKDNPWMQYFLENLQKNTSAEYKTKFKNIKYHFHKWSVEDFNNMIKSGILKYLDFSQKEYNNLFEKYIEQCYCYRPNDLKNNEFIQLFLEKCVFVEKDNIFEKLDFEKIPYEKIKLHNFITDVFIQNDLSFSKAFIQTHDKKTIDKTSFIKSFFTPNDIPFKLFAFSSLLTLSIIPIGTPLIIATGIVQISTGFLTLLHYNPFKRFAQNFKEAYFKNLDKKDKTYAYRKNRFAKYLKEKILEKGFVLENIPDKTLNINEFIASLNKVNTAQETQKAIEQEIVAKIKNQKIEKEEIKKVHSLDSFLQLLTPYQDATQEMKKTISLINNNKTIVKTKAFEDLMEVLNKIQELSLDSIDTPVADRELSTIILQQREALKEEALRKQQETKTALKILSAKS